MLKLLLPVLLGLGGTAGGIALALLLPAPPATPEAPAPGPCGDAAAAEPPAGTDGEGAAHAGHAIPAPGEAEAPPLAERDYARLANQFVIPIVEEARVSALVVLGISVEVPVGQTETVHAHEPRLRDSFLRVMFDFANSGGFDGAFTTAANLRQLRAELLAAARAAIGPMVSDVLIVDILRQDIR